MCAQWAGEELPNSEAEDMPVTYEEMAPDNAPLIPDTFTYPHWEGEADEESTQDCSENPFGIGAETEDFDGYTNELSLSLE